jgi:hypothetical protein
MTKSGENASFSAFLPLVAGERERERASWCAWPPREPISLDQTNKSHAMERLCALGKWVQANAASHANMGPCPFHMIRKGKGVMVASVLN